MRTRSSTALRLFLIGTTFCLLGLLSAGAAAAQDGTATPAPASTPTNPTAEGTPAVVRECAECHLDVVVGWQGSTHATAYSNPVFQEAWNVKADPACLACHTTGFNPRTDTYTQQGVACEACHGVTSPNHPPEAVKIETGVETCAGCHPTTLAEWKVSGHGSQQLACTTCHNPHPQTLRFETAQALCLNCHTEIDPHFAHVSHTEQQCVDCHWYKGGNLDVHVMSGNLFPTGHDNAVETRTCLDCHGELAAKAIAEGGATPSAPETLEETLHRQELEARLRTVQAETQNSALLRTLEGVILGTLVGAIAFMLVQRFGRGQKRATRNPESGTGDKPSGEGQA